MNHDRATNRVIRGVTRGDPLTFTLDSQPIEAFPGETIAAALLAVGIRTMRRTEKTNTPRGLFCGMGVCFDCLIVVDGRPHMRACLTEAKQGMRVTTQDEAAWQAERR